MEPKKISFGFCKLKKPTLIQSAKPVEKEEKTVQYIDCVEESSIKVIGGEEQKVKAPLVIPMKPNKNLLNLEDIVRNDFNLPENDVKIEPSKEEGSIEQPFNPQNLSLDELAARELLNEVKKEVTEAPKIVEIPKTDAPVIDGEKESTLEDYDNVPIQDFGLAMLRGMGWKEDLGIGKTQKVIKTVQPVVRPKGMGLGADKLVKQSTAKPAVDKEGKVLTCRKGSFVKINAGLHKASYGQIIGFDEESSRFIVKLALNNMNVTLNEFLVTPVTKDDYVKNSKVLNNDKYEEFLRKKQTETSEDVVKSEKDEVKIKTERHERVDIKKEIPRRSRDSSEGSNYESKPSSSYKKHKSSEGSDSDERHKKKSKKTKKEKYRSSSDSEADSDYKRKNKKSKHKKKKKYRSESDSDVCKNKDDKRERTRERKYKRSHKSKDRDRDKYDKYGRSKYNRR